MIGYRRLLFVLLCMAAATNVSAEGRVRIAVVTKFDPSGLVDKAAEDRLAAVADIKKRLSRNSAVELVDSVDAAQAVLEVTFIGTRDGGPTVSTVIPVGGAAVITPPGKVLEFVGQARLTSGTFTTDLEASIGPFGRSYGENLARKFEDWLKKNAAVLQVVK